MDRFTAMHSFVRVASLRSFARAAGELGVAPATVTAHVQHLERLLGVRLLERNTRSLRLTEEGAVYFEHCCRTLEEMRQVEGRLASGGPALRGVLRADVPVVLGRRLIAPRLPAFLGRHPQLALHLSMENRSQDLIGRGWDCAIRIAALPDSSLIARRLGVIRWITCAAPEYLARAGEPRSPAELARHNCLLNTHYPDPDQWLYQREHELFRVEVGGGLASNHYTLLKKAVPACQILMVTTFGRPGYLRRAMQAGASGFVVKDTPARQLADAVRRVASGLRVVDPALAAESPHARWMIRPMQHGYHAVSDPPNAAVHRA